MFKLTFGGITFDGSERLTSQDVFQLRTIRGWDAPAGARNRSEDRPTSDGEFDLPLYLGARQVIVSGYLESSSRFAQRSMVDRLGLLPIREDGVVTVQDGPDTRFVYGRRVGAPDVSVVVFGRYLECELEIKCGDPLKYGAMQSFSGANVGVFHRGSYTAAPRVKVTGVSGGYTVSGPEGRRFVVSSGPGSGQDVIDMRTGLLRRNGTVLRGAVTRAQTWGVPADAPPTPMSISAGSMTVEVVDTYG
jgi:hypothetical protein